MLQRLNLQPLPPRFFNTHYYSKSYYKLWIVIIFQGEKGVDGVLHGMAWLWSPRDITKKNLSNPISPWKISILFKGLRRCRIGPSTLLARRVRWVCPPLPKLPRGRISPSIFPSGVVGWVYIPLPELRQGRTNPFTPLLGKVWACISEKITFFIF